MQIELRKITIFVYIMCVMGMILSNVDNVPFHSALTYTRFIYLGILYFQLILEMVPIHKKVTGIVGIIILHTIVWGFIAVNETVIGATHEHAKEMILMILFVYGTIHYIRYNESLLLFIKATFISCFISVLWCYITHFSGFAPLRYLFQLPGIIKDQVDYGFSYGFDSYNLAGNVIATTLWLLFLMCALEQNKNHELKVNAEYRKLYKVITLILTLYLILLLVSTTSRGEILSIVFGIIAILFMFGNDYAISERVLIFRKSIGMIFLVGIVVFNINTITGNDLAKRSSNWSINKEAFEIVGRRFLGMGYINPWGFLMKSFPGIETSPCDVFWLYIYFTTGIIGAGIIIGVLVYLFLNVLKHNSGNRWYDIIIKAMIPMLIFNNFYHATLLSYNYMCSKFVLIFLLEFLMESRDAKSMRCIDG